MKKAFQRWKLRKAERLKNRKMVEEDTLNRAKTKIAEYFFLKVFVMYRLEKQNLPDYIVTMIEKVVL